MATKKRKLLGSIERNLQMNIANPDHYPRIIALGKALSSNDRLRVLDILRGRSLSIMEVASALKLPVSSVAFHFRCLEEANLIITESQPGVRGSMRIGLCSVHQVLLEADTAASLSKSNVFAYNMPIGNYFDCDISPTCGLADEHGLIGKYDDVRSFYAAERMRAQLIWFQHGYLEYRFPNPCTVDMHLTELSFSLELCAEAPGHQEEWPTDITFSINGQTLGTYTSPGDFGARRGLYTPESWPVGSTQYGLLTTLSVRERGGYIDEALVNANMALSDLGLLDSPYIALRIEASASAAHAGGINIFGEKFGDYNQNIAMRLHSRLVQS